MSPCSAALTPKNSAVHSASAGLAVPAGAYAQAFTAAVEDRQVPTDLWTSVWVVPEDDGTHGVFSEAAALARDAEHGAGAVDAEEAVVRVGGPARTEMRQVLPAPVSLSAYL